MDPGCRLMFQSALACGSFSRFQDMILLFEARLMNACPFHVLVHSPFAPQPAICSSCEVAHPSPPPVARSHVVIYTSQTMQDIPYGDYFSVEVRWDVEDLPGRGADCCNLRISLDVPFAKKTVWKGARQGW